MTMLFSVFQPSGRRERDPGIWSRGCVLMCVLLATLYWSRGVAADEYSITRIGPVISSIAPSPTLSSSSPSTTTSSAPSPSPVISQFLRYVQPYELYIQITKMELFIYTTEGGYYNLTVGDYPTLMSLPSTESFNQSDNTINYTKSYQYDDNNGTTSDFVFSFILTLEPTTTDQMWYISKFTHRNRSSDSNSTTTTCSFHYSGIPSVHSPSDLSYHCSDIRFKGDCVDKIMSEVHFKGLLIQAFQLNNKTPSNTYVDCAAKSHNNSVINLVVGTVVGTTIGIALIIIIVTLVIKRVSRNVRWRGYNLLDD